MMYKQHKHRVLLLTLILSCGAVLATLSGCSSSTTPSDSSTVTMQSEFTGTHVTPGIIRSGSGSQIQGQHGLVVDSLQITSAKIFIKDIKLHHQENDSLDDSHNETIKVGPFVAEFNSAGGQILTTAVIPPGTYDRIKLEIHKFDKDNDKHDDLDKDDSSNVFKEPNSYTFIISGYVWVGGVKSPFTYYSKVTANIMWHFPQMITLGAGSAQTLIMKLDPVYMFQIIGFALDPRDPKNQTSIDFAIKSSIKFIAKF